MRLYRAVTVALAFVLTFTLCSAQTVPCSAITRNPQVLEALLEASVHDEGSQEASRDEAISAGALEGLQFLPIVVQPGDALYVEYLGRDFTVFGEYAGGDMTAFDAPAKANFEEWRKGILLLDHRLGLNQKLVRLSAMSREPERVQFRNIRIIRSGKPVFEFATLANYKALKVHNAVQRTLPCVGKGQPMEAAAFEPPMIYPSNTLPPKPTATPYGMMMTPSAAPMLQGGGGSGTTNRYRFTGKELDEESGLYNYGARMYGSTMGRFLTPDWSAVPTPVPYAELANPQTLNLYSYAKNNPLRYNDPDGHCPDGGGCMLLLDPNYRAGYQSGAEIGFDLVSLAGPLMYVNAGYNAVQSYFRGNNGSAAANLASMVPLGGIFAKLAKIESVAARLGKIEALGSNVVNTALQGGKHAGFLENYLGRSAGELSSGISSLGKQIAAHESKIANPAKHIEGWASLSAKEQQGLINKWQKDIQRQKEQREILEALNKTQRAQ